MRTAMLAVALLLGSPLASQATTATEAYRAMGLKPKDVLSGTSLNARVIPGEPKQLVCITTYFTGKRDRSDAVNVRLDVFETRGAELEPLFSRNIGHENDGNVGEGNLQLVDLDMDGVSEIIVSYASFEDPLIRQELAEVIVYEDSTFRTAWSGPIKYDATKAARELPVERRDRFNREFDLVGTLQSRGRTLFVKKTMIAVAGERLAEPKTVQETFPLRAGRR